MKTLIKLFLTLVGLFASTFILLKLIGVLTVDDIRGWLEAARSVSPVYIGLVIAGLLFADLFIAVPTLTLSLLSGYFLGFAYGAAFNILGVTAAGITGYMISRTVGRTLLEKVIRDPAELEEMEATFDKHGFVMILISRALPILPEAMACLSGFTRMRAWKFLLAWTISSLPYAVITAYAGSVSSIDDPKPALITAFGLSVFLWAAWVVFLRFRKGDAGGR